MKILLHFQGWARGFRAAAAEIDRLRPFALKDFYTAFYRAVGRSQAHAAFCERVFGRNLCQHGFADMAQLELILRVTQLQSTHRALDLGCGNGMIAEYLSDRSGAHITGLDYISQAIAQAQDRTISKKARLDFVTGEINQLELAAEVYDVTISVDTMYFSHDYLATIGGLKRALRTGGQMAILYSYGLEQSSAEPVSLKEQLLPERTPLGQALVAHGLEFRTRDLTVEDYELAKRRKQVLAELKPQFEAEGILFIYENRMGDAEGIIRAVEEGLHSRYLYHVGISRQG